MSLRWVPQRYFPQTQHWWDPFETLFWLCWLSAIFAQIEHTDCEFCGKPEELWIDEWGILTFSFITNNN